MSIYYNYVSAFLRCDKYLGKQFTRRTVSSGSRCQRFQSSVIGSVVLGPRLDPRGEDHMVKKSSSPLSGKEKHETKYAFQSYTSSGLLHPHRPYLPKAIKIQIIQLLEIH